MKARRSGGSIVGTCFSLTVICGLTGVALPLPPPGDANEDGIVSGADFTVFLDNYGATGVPRWSDGGCTVGNFNDDTVVDPADYSEWALRCGLGGTPATVPGPGLACRVSDLGGGLYGFRLSVCDGYGGTGSFFANVTFQGAWAEQSQNPGTIQQLQVSFPVPPNVDYEADADLWDYHDPNYHKERDSYFLNPFHGPVMWFDEAANYYSASISTECATYHTAAPLAYICCTGDVVYDGIISHLGQEYSLSGMAQIPPPGPSGFERRHDLMGKRSNGPRPQLQ